VAHAPTQETIAQAYALAASAVEEARYGLLLTRYVLLVQFLKRMRTSTSSSALLEIQKIQSLPERLPGLRSFLDERHTKICATIGVDLLEWVNTARKNLPLPPVNTSPEFAYYGDAPRSALALAVRYFRAVRHSMEQDPPTRDKVRRGLCDGVLQESILQRLEDELIQRLDEEGELLTRHVSRANLRQRFMGETGASESTYKRCLAEARKQGRDLTLDELLQIHGARGQRQRTSLQKGPRTAKTKGQKKNRRT